MTAAAGPPAGAGLPGAAGALGLPAGVQACLFDVDGVLTRTAKVHAAAWKAYDGPVRYVKADRTAGLRFAVVSSSKNCAAVLAAAGIADLFEERVDGLTAERDHLAGKPAPDMYLAAARGLGAVPAGCAVFEDALAGVAAGAAGGFGLVVGVDRAGPASELTARGADAVVADLAELLAVP